MTDSQQYTVPGTTFVPGDDPRYKGTVEQAGTCVSVHSPVQAARRATITTLSTAILRSSYTIHRVAYERATVQFDIMPRSRRNGLTVCLVHQNAVGTDYGSTVQLLLVHDDICLDLRTHGASRPRHLDSFIGAIAGELERRFLDLAVSLLPIPKA